MFHVKKQAWNTGIKVTQWKSRCVKRHPGVGWRKKDDRVDVRQNEDFTEATDCVIAVHKEYLLTPTFGDGTNKRARRERYWAHCPILEGECDVDTEQWSTQRLRRGNCLRRTRRQDHVV